MRKLLIRRRGVSTMIGGMIVLALFLSAIGAMILISYQYDSYQTTVDKMQQKDAERFAENLRPVPPALAKGDQFSISCGVGNCNNYTLTVGNLGIGMQIGRIYINTTEPGVGGCTSVCILDPATSAAPYRFSASDRFLNPGETKNITLWLPGDAPNIVLPDDNSGANSIWVATTRGRVFSFQWPLPPQGPGGGVAAGGPGGTGLYIGPLVITFQKGLIAYTTNSSGRINMPQGGTNGYWAIPLPPLIIYIKIQTDVGTQNDVYLTAQSVLELAQFNNPGNVIPFFIVAPITPALCDSFAKADPRQDVNCDPAYGYYDAGNNGDPGTPAVPLLVPYQSCNQIPYSRCPNRYLIPRPTPLQILRGERGDPVIVAFAATTASGNKPWGAAGGFSPGNAATSFLGLTYVYNDGTGDYTYAVTLPFMAICINNPSSNPSKCPG